MNTVVNEAANETAGAITNTGNKTSGNQANALAGAAGISLDGANHKANAGILICAEGANKEVENSGSGVSDVADCQQKFKTAEELAAIAGKNGFGGALRPDQKLLNDPASVATLDKFQQNFSIDKDEYIRRMLASFGRQTELADMMSSKFGDEKLDKFFTAVAEVEPKSPDEIKLAQESGVSEQKPVKKDSSLRDSLRAKLAAADAARRPASSEGLKTDYSSVPTASRLVPAGLNRWIQGDDQDKDTEATIFDIMHQKLEDLRRRERI